ncbi:hypothetical protein MAPG_03659 [Magnaporthiopsis poae ATCC 64411]|uniref:Uncharacterized protein n=1 Tax=Magnaporthiopsis poae (strain ATCC 64411 / 73-15) TaxID=644358 RepID=A0A0C4DUL9_MAGP6|nr:hypothetical protein MAPG_03659 [Magnaporthiopsis poae ATCC 64411]
MQEPGLPYELLVAIYTHLINDFLSRPRLVSLEARDYPQRGDPELRLVYHNSRTLQQGDSIRSLRLVGQASKQIVDHIIRTLLPLEDSRRAHMLKFPKPLRGLLINPHTDVFFLSSIVLAVAHPLMFFPGIHGIQVEDIRALRNIVVAAREMKLCLQGWWEIERHGESDANMLQLLSGRDASRERVVVLLGADGVSDGVCYEQLVIVSEADAQSIEQHFPVIREELLLLGFVMRMWRRWREVKHATLPRLEFARIRRDLDW